MPLIAAGIIISILYFLLVKGYLFKLIILIFGFLGLYWFLETYIPASKQKLIEIAQYDISWSICVPVVLVVLLLLTTKATK
jgi:hypothetical protein